MSDIDWMDTPLSNFLSVDRRRADGTLIHETFPLGDGEAQRLLTDLSFRVQDAYGRLLPEEEDERFESKGEVPLIHEGRRTYEDVDRLTLRDLPAILDGLVVLEEDYRRRKREEAECKAAERNRRKNERAKERRRLKKLGNGN